ncbi:hypothetical protein [Pseudonocardia sp. DLS-67]
MLGDSVKGTSAAPWSHYVPATVVQELAGHGVARPAWAEEVHVDGLAEIVAFAAWSQRIVSGPHNRGEAAVIAWAESHSAIAILDDKDARLVAQQLGLDAHGSIWLLCQAINAGTLTARNATAYFDAVTAAGARMPFGQGGFERWTRGQGLIG